MSRLVAWLTSAGDPRLVGPVVARALLAVMFLQAGVGKFVAHDDYIERFDRWGFPAPGAVAYLVGVVEVVCAVLMATGILPRLAGPVLAGNMAGAFLTAGFVDGGQNLWLPPILAALALYVAWAGAGRYRLHERILPVDGITIGGRTG